MKFVSRLILTSVMHSLEWIKKTQNLSIAQPFVLLKFFSLSLLSIYLSPDIHIYGIYTHIMYTYIHTYTYICVCTIYLSQGNKLLGLMRKCSDIKQRGGCLLRTTADLGHLCFTFVRPLPCLALV